MCTCRYKAHPFFMGITLSLSLNIFILHQLRNKFQQLTLISLDSASWELHQYSRRMCGPMKNPKVETRSRDSNSGLHDCKADALPHDRGHHTFSVDIKPANGEKSISAGQIMFAIRIIYMYEKNHFSWIYR